MSTFDKISVIVPVYNAEKYLNSCVDSLLGQTYSNIEIILVDDGSFDTSGEICDLYALKNECIHVIHKENGGVSSARNEGIANAIGDYICFVDADDYIDKEMLTKLYNKIIDREKDISLCGIELVENGEFVLLEENFKGINNEFERVKNIIYGTLFGSASRCIFPKSLIEKYNLKFKKFRHCEDQVFFIEIASHAKNIYVVNEPLYYYRRNIDSGAKSKYYVYFLNDRMLYFEAIKHIVQKLNANHREKKKLIDRIVSNLQIALYFNAVMSPSAKSEIKEIDDSIIGKYRVSFKENVRVLFKSDIRGKLLFILVKLRLFKLLGKIRRKNSEKKLV